MSDEEYIVRREVDVDEIDTPVEEADGGSVFDNEFRILVLSNSSVSMGESDEGDRAGAGDSGSVSVNVEESDMEEILVRQVRTLADVNEFFDAFDAQVAVPNEGHLKYEVGSDGLCVVLVDSVAIKASVVAFVNKFIESHAETVDRDGHAGQDDGEDDGEDASRSSKRRR